MISGLLFLKSTLGLCKEQTRGGKKIARMLVRKSLHGPGGRLWKHLSGFTVRWHSVLRFGVYFESMVTDRLDKGNEKDKSKMVPRSFA